MSYRLTYPAGVHVEWTCILVNTCIKVGHVLLEGMSNMRSGFIGWHVMLGNMYYWKVCGSGGLVFYENICCGRTCLVGGHVLQFCRDAAII